MGAREVHAGQGQIPGYKILICLERSLGMSAVMSRIQCPKCESKMETVTFGGVVVDRCSACFGIWFDASEKEHLRDLEGSEIIDQGDPEIGKEMNRRRRVPCPRCGGRMIPMVDRKKFRIQYEHCTICGGSFFDAGEFKEYKRRAVLD